MSYSRQLGSANANAKLNEQDVEVIRWRAENKRQKIKNIKGQIAILKQQLSEAMASDSIPQMAFDFDVKEGTIKNVLYNKGLWGHVK